MKINYKLFRNRHTPCRWMRTWIHCWTKCYLRCKGHLSHMSGPRQGWWQVDGCSWQIWMDWTTFQSIPLLYLVCPPGRWNPQTSFIQSLGPWAIGVPMNSDNPDLRSTHEELRAKEDFTNILLMEEILHQLRLVVEILSFTRFLHPRCLLGIPTINSRFVDFFVELIDHHRRESNDIFCNLPKFPEILQIRLKGLQVVVGCFHSVRPWVATAPLRMRKVTSNDVLKPLMPPTSVAIEVWSLHCPLKLQGQACCEDRGQVKLRIDKLLNSRDLLQRRMELGPIDTPKYFRTWKATGKIYSFLSGRLQKSRVPPFWCASMIVETVYSCVLQVIWCTISITLWCARHHGTKWIVHNTPCHFFFGRIQYCH